MYRFLRALAPSAAALAVLALLTVSAGAQQFVRDAAALSSPATWTNGVAVADYDGDGLLDLAFANGLDYGPGGALPQRLYLGDGAGNFTDVSGQLNVANFNAQMVIAEDCDGDGDMDLIYAPAGPFPATTQRARILVNDGTANFTDESATRMPLTTMSAWCVVAADLDNDGDRDLVLNDGCLTFSGQPGQAKIFENDGTGTGHFTIDTTLDQLCTSNSYEVDWSDLDGDGDWDAAVQSISSFNEGWGENRGLGVPPPETVFTGANGNDDNEMASMDYDMDGDMDVFVGSLSANREKVYRQDAFGVFNRVNIFQQITDSTLDLGFGDFDGDGRHDVVTAQGESGVQVNKIYDNNGALDTLVPRVLDMEVPGAVVAGGQVFRLFAQDDWVDDGISNVLVSYAWETFVGGVSEASGGGDATFQGGCMWRALVPTTGATDGVAVTWTVSDDVGNTATPVLAAVGDIGNDSWMDLGNGLAGTGAVTPVLSGSGPLTAGSANALQLDDALASSTTALVVGYSQIDAGFKGGVLVPAADLIIPGLPVGAGGSFTLPFVWPAGVPASVNVWFQHWITDGGGPSGFSASNGLKATTP
ncbi:MAG: FG-GAP repeat domain-containing protein [Planctomycetota bacterium]|jgi:hypothetical protein